MRLLTVPPSTGQCGFADESFCRFHPYVLPGCYAVLSFSDTGVGMDE